MQTKQTTGRLATLADDYVTIVKQAAGKVTGFEQLESRGTTSATFFKFTVYGLRYACRMRGLEYKQFSLPL